MSIIADAEAAVKTATGTRWVRLALRLAPYAAIVVLAVALLATRATLATVRLTDRATLAADRQHDAEANAANADRRSAALATYASQIAAREPLIVHSTDTVTRYAETPAGHAPCLGADRVHGLDALDASLVAPAAPEGSASPVRPDAGTPPAGR